MSAADELERRREAYGVLDPRWPDAEVRVKYDDDGVPTISILCLTPSGGLHASQLVGVHPDDLPRSEPA